MKQEENKKPGIGIIAGLLLGFLAGYLVSKDKKTSREVEDGIDRVKAEALKLWSSMWRELDKRRDPPEEKPRKKKKGMVN